MLRSVEEARDAWYPGRCDCVMRSIAAGRLGPSGSRDELFIRDESVACSEDSADDAVFELIWAFLRMSRLPSPPTESRWCTSTVSPSPPSSEASESPPPSIVERLLRRGSGNTNVPG